MLPETNTRKHSKQIHQRDGQHDNNSPEELFATVTSATCFTRLASPASSSSRPTPTPRPATSCFPSPPPRACGSLTPSRTSTWPSPQRTPFPPDTARVQGAAHQLGEPHHRHGVFQEVQRSHWCHQPVQTGLCLAYDF